MAPRMEEQQHDENNNIEGLEPLPDNAELIEGAGNIKLAAPKLWGLGILSDIRQTVGSHWFEEMTNLNQKTISVTLLIYISVIAPILTFGAVYGKETNNTIGVMETMIATSWVGVVYSLIGGMPLCIMGSTAPILAFTSVIYDLADSIGVPYLTFNAWVSVWLFAFTFLAGFFDMTRYVRLATRFTDEIFALLIASIFVLDAIGDPFSDIGILRYLAPDHPSHKDHQDDPDYSYLATGLLSVLLGFGTTLLIFVLRAVKRSPFFYNRRIRAVIHDYAVAASVVVWTLVKHWFFDSIQTESLIVPDDFEPTFACCDASCTTFFPDECPDQDTAAGTRTWFVDFFDLNGKSWVIVVAAGPAALAFVLCYLDNGLTWHLINKKIHNLQHGEAYNYDLCLNGLFNFVNGMLGLPWLFASTVNCTIHLNALADTDEDGKFVRVQETRLTMFLSHVLVGLSILFLDALEEIPLAVLYGVFLFLGLSVLPGMQFWQRLLLFLQQPSEYTQTHYLKYVDNARVHKYTMYQILFFGLVFAFRNADTVAIAFPLMLFFCIPARLYMLPRLFEGWELLLLDGEDEALEEWLDAKHESIRNWEFRKSQHIKTEKFEITYEDGDDE